MSTVITLLIGSLSLGALYFMLGSGLTLSFGLMRVVNFAHGAFLTLGAFAGYAILMLWPDPTIWQVMLAALASLIVGALLALVIEWAFIRRLYDRVVAQLLVTIGLGYVILALLSGFLTDDPRRFPTGDFLESIVEIGGARIPAGRLVIIGVGVVVFVLIIVFLRSTRHGLIIRAGVENSAMVTALGIDIRRSFVLVFALGGALAGLGGTLAGVYFGSIYPSLGQGLLIFSFVVVVMGGTGSVVGCGIAALIVATCQQFVNFYIGHGTGDFIVVILLAGVLLVRPQGLLGKKALAI